MAENKDLMDLAKSLEDASKQATEQHKSDIQDIVNQILTAEMGEELAKPIVAMLALDDEQFQILAPMILLNINKDLHDSNNQLMMLSTFNAQGITLDAMRDSIDHLIEVLDADASEISGFSKSKIDFLKQIVHDLYNAISEIKGIPKRIITVPLEKCHADAKVPVYAHPTDAGLDVYALEDITIKPGETKLIPTGLKVAIPVGYELQVRGKSGICLKTKLRIGNAPGTIDAGYRDEIGVIVDNIEAPIKSISYDESGKLVCEYGSSYTIGKGQKFAQLILSDIQHAQFYEVESVADIGEDRQGGFGSTGLQ